MFLGYFLVGSKLLSVVYVSFESFYKIKNGGIDG